MFFFCIESKLTDVISIFSSLPIVRLEPTIIKFDTKFVETNIISETPVLFTLMRKGYFKNVEPTILIGKWWYW